jgi:hypothetical protein
VSSDADVVSAIQSQGPLEITHLVARSPIPKHWAPLSFITRKVGTSEPVFYGLDFFHPHSVKKVDQSSNTIRLETPIPLSPERGPWLLPDDSVWLANWENPVEDQEKWQLVTKLFQLTGQSE